MGRKGTLTADRNVNWPSYYGNKFGGFSKLFKWNLHVIQLYHSKVYAKKNKSQFMMETSAYPGLLLTIHNSQILGSAKCPSVDEWIKINCGIYAQ
jgi:hypothetical protein